MKPNNVGESHFFRVRQSDDPDGEFFGEMGINCFVVEPINKHQAGRLFAVQETVKVIANSIDFISPGVCGTCSNIVQDYRNEQRSLLTGNSLDD